MMTLNNKMEWTGERYTPGNVSGPIEVEHWHRYALARELLVGKDVLDIASGEGYGTNFLAEKAKTVIGVDVSAEAVIFSKSKYIKANLEFRVGSCSKIPLEDLSVDVVVSFETLEHHGEHYEMFREVKRILRPGGLLIISSPDKYNYSERTNSKNEFHVKELYKKEFEDLLRSHFKNYRLLGQRLVSGSLIANEEASLNSSLSKKHFVETDTGPIPKQWLDNSNYFIAIATDDALPEVSWSTLESEWLQRYYEKGIRDEARRLELEIEKAMADTRSAQDRADVANQTAHDAHKKLHEANKELNLIRIEYHKLISSKSWKITAPLRSFMGNIREMLRS